MKTLLIIIALLILGIVPAKAEQVPDDVKETLDRLVGPFPSGGYHETFNKSFCFVNISRPNVC